MSGVTRYALLLGIAGLVIALDQITKAIVTNELAGHAPLSVLGGLVYLDYARNTGAAFSILPNGARIFEVVAAVVCAGILLWYPRLRGTSLLVRLALGLILGGAAGNLLDRVRLGYVVDFVDLRWWPVFNLADSAVVAGACLLALYSVRKGERT